MPETDHWGYVNDKIVMQGEVYTGKINKLKGQVRMMLQKVVDPFGATRADRYLAKTRIVLSL